MIYEIAELESTIFELKNQIINLKNENNKLITEIISLRKIEELLEFSKDKNIKVTKIILPQYYLNNLRKDSNFLQELYQTNIEDNIILSIYGLDIEINNNIFGWFLE